MQNRILNCIIFFLGISICLLAPDFGAAAELGTIKGTISDPLGAVIPNAQVALYRDTKQAGATTTDTLGAFQFSSLRSGRYHIRAKASQFTSETSPDVYLGGGTTQINLSLKVGTTTQEIVVSATGTEIPDSQVGASVSVINQDQFQNKLDVLEPLRLVPGLQIIQTGGRGGQASFFLRGGNENANKVLLDGIPINDIGGGIGFSNVAETGISQVEVLRGPNSVLYGADALSGVINLTTRRGTTPLPEFIYSGDGKHHSGEPIASSIIFQNFHASTLATVSRTARFTTVHMQEILAGRQPLLHNCASLGDVR